MTTNGVKVEVVGPCGTFWVMPHEVKSWVEIGYTVRDRIGQQQVHGVQIPPGMLKQSDQDEEC